MLDDYRATVRPPYQELLKNYRFIGAAQKVVGVGSVGTLCAVALFMAANDDPNARLEAETPED